MIISTYLVKTFRRREIKKLIVTGANGQLGRAINKQYAASTEYELVNTAVEKCEQEEDLAFRINAIGARNLSIAASETGAKLIHVSTDFMFADWHDAIAEYLKDA